jgi:membrane-associated phospholipid phosphatase
MIAVNDLHRILPVIFCYLLSLVAPASAEMLAVAQGPLFAKFGASTTLALADEKEMRIPRNSDHESSLNGTDRPWRRASLTDYVGSSVVLAGTLYSEAAYGNPRKAQWTARNGFDEGIRDALRLNSSSARDAASTASDVLMGLLIAAPVLDSFATIGIRGGNWDVTWQTEMINLESFAFTGLASSVMANSIRRERPLARNCVNGNCPELAPNRSMPSGHEAFAFTGAGLLCTNHSYQNRYADPDTERAACAISLGLAATTGVLRIMADSHYATDVAVGTLIGLFSGFALPRLLHYSWHIDAEQVPGTAVRKESTLVNQVIVAPQVLNGGAALKCDVIF